MTPDPTRLSFVFPMWNEEAMIRRTVAAAREAGTRDNTTAIVVDNVLVQPTAPHPLPAAA